VTGWDPLVINCSDLELEEDLSSALTNADVIIIQNNNKELLRQFKLQAKANIKKGVLIYDFWNVLSKKDLPEQSNLISLGKIL
jgi:UDP-glucose 6-dehydrogenase